MTHSPSSTLAATIDALLGACCGATAPGIVAAVSMDGELVYRGAAGLASIEHGTSNTPRTRMRIGSTSKHITALAALLLVDEGKLDLDAGIRRYVPELPELAFEPTVRQLLNHTGGYRCHVDLGLLADGLAIQPRGAGLAMLCRQRGANFAPGEKINYVNSGYHLVSLVIERQSGMPFGQFLGERIFTPLGMSETLSVSSDFQLVEGMATMHLPSADGSWRRGILPSEQVLGEGAVVSTVDDMLRWLAHLRGPKRVGSAAAWAELLTKARLNNGFEAPYSLGLMHETYRGLRTLHHAGGVVGGASQMLTVPDHKLDIVVHTNSGAVDPIAIAWQILDTVLGDATLAPRPPLASSQRYATLCGSRYHNPVTGDYLGFVDIGGRLCARVMNGMPVPLTEDGSGALTSTCLADWASGAVRVIASNPDQLLIEQDGKVGHFDRLPDVTATAAEAGASLIGSYRVADLGADAEVSSVGKALHLEIHGTHGINVIVLAPIDADLFEFQVPGAPVAGVVQALRGADGNATVQALLLSTPRTRSLRFDRVDQKGQYART